MLWYHSLYEIYMRSLLYYARVRAWNVLNCQELALTTITVRVLVSIITVITTDCRPHSVLILHLQMPPSPGLCAPFHWNLTQDLRWLHSIKHFYRSWQGNCVRFSACISNIFNVWLLQRMTKEQPMRFIVAIHTILQQYVLEWVNQQTLNIPCDNSFFVEHVIAEPEQWQKVILDI